MARTELAMGLSKDYKIHAVLRCYVLYMRRDDLSHLFFSTKDDVSMFTVDETDPTVVQVQIG